MDTVFGFTLLSEILTAGKCQQQTLLLLKCGINMQIMRNKGPQRMQCQTVADSLRICCHLDTVGYARPVHFAINLYGMKWHTWNATQLV